MGIPVDVFITTKGRPDLLRRSLESFLECTDESLYRLTVVQDGLDHGNATGVVIQDFWTEIDHVLIHQENLGLGPSINQALAHIQALNEWFAHPTHGYRPLVTQFVCYCQDDLLYSKGWLERLISSFCCLEKAHNIGFASGVECVEHAVKRDIGGGMVLKDWVRAAQLFARREYWMSMFPIPRLDPETGRVRAKPNDGMGSGVDWHFIRNHPNSVCRTGRNCLVIPGLVSHMGYDRSTWLARELPESERDKARVREASDA
jgi:glycosyltransferase involved in cell wall biosynthesis